ncbi:secA translation cis-regulator SecM [Paramixta manurensis]|uniref:secA translation cis-regulator SecM n=1 Tax=Paramixta manurensis TaxID=2740817 RepID=UPI00156BA0DC
MIGIFNRWRQFGRRYFWPHLLLGMVAASLGLPGAHAQNTEKNSFSESSSNSLSIGKVARFDSLALLQESARRPTFNVDYWHQHAIRTVIRHLSFTLAPQGMPDAEQALPLAVQKLALIDTLNALLTREVRPPVIIRRTQNLRTPIISEYHTGLWLAQVRGIRAGPYILS